VDGGCSAVSAADGIGMRRTVGSIFARTSTSELQCIAMTTSFFLGRKNKKAANLCGVHGLFGESVCLVLDQLSSGPDATTRGDMHTHSRRPLAGME
jgi:hypothetical protein